jgi:hypothetical protein
MAIQFPARKLSQTGVPAGTPRYDIPGREFASRAVDGALWFHTQCTADRPASASASDFSFAMTLQLV